MLDASLPIGVFDSGMGGLTVLKALQKHLPDESYLYLGDTARLPYGTKSLTTVQHYAEQMTRALLKRGIKALVIACNTASTAALPLLQNKFPEIPIIGVLAPSAQLAIKETKNQHIFLLATETTIHSKGYQNKILETLPNAKIKAIPANLLVALAEENLIEHPITIETIKYYLSSLEDEDTLILGCTHFPVFTKTFQSLLPQIHLVNPAEATAYVLKNALLEKNLYRSHQTSTTQYFVTDSIQRFQKVGQVFLGQSLDEVVIELIDA